MTDETQLYKTYLYNNMKHIMRRILIFIVNNYINTHTHTYNYNYINFFETNPYEIRHDNWT